MMPNARANNANTAECPFCQREVDSELVAYGGKCPYCFGEIPGEEAPTDPGEAKKKAEQKVMAAQMQRGKVLPLVLVSMLMVTPICAGVAILLRPTPPMPTLNLDEGEFALGEIGEIVAAPAVVAPPITEVKVETKATPTSTKVTTKVTPSTDLVVGEDPNKATTKVETAPVIDPTKPPPVKSGSGLTGPTIDIARREVKGVTLTDDNLIIEMVKKTVTTELGKLRYQCYEPILKRVPELQGSWLLNFTVKPDGSVTAPSAAAKPGTAANAELETCIKQKLVGWSFQPIKAELPVTKSVGFRPG